MGQGLLRCREDSGNHPGSSRKIFEFGDFVVELMIQASATQGGFTQISTVAAGKPA
jgi:hypothetical protein